MRQTRQKGGSFEFSLAYTGTHLAKGRMVRNIPIDRGGNEIANY